MLWTDSNIQSHTGVLPVAKDELLSRRNGSRSEVGNLALYIIIDNLVIVFNVDLSFGWVYLSLQWV